MSNCLYTKFEGTFTRGLVPDGSITVDYWLPEDIITFGKNSETYKSRPAAKGSRLKCGINFNQEDPSADAPGIGGRLERS